jgi:MFS family permease
MSIELKAKGLANMIFKKLMEKQHFLLFLGIGIWIPTSLLLGFILTIYVLPDIVEQPLSNVDPNNDPIDWVLLLSVFFFLFVVPLLAFLTGMLVTITSKRFDVCKRHIGVLLAYLVITLMLIGKASYDVISLSMIFGYFFVGTVCSHFIAREYQNRIALNFYKYLEYIYVIAAIAGLLSASEPVENLYAQKISTIERRITDAIKEQKTDGCTGQVASNKCLDFENQDALYAELKDLKAHKPQKIDSFLKIIGYLVLTIALNIKLIKISGELYSWHRKQ